MLLYSKLNKENLSKTIQKNLFDFSIDFYKIV